MSPVSIDLTRLHRRTVTSFYSNLVTRPTGRAVRMGVESQIAELDREQNLCLSILDFTQVRVLDYSCADEIVAKLLLRYSSEDRPAEVFFLARGLHDHHREAVVAVLERHDLLLVAEDANAVELLGPSDPIERTCWDALVRLGRAQAHRITEDVGIPMDVVSITLNDLAARRVAVSLPDGALLPIHTLASL